MKYVYGILAVLTLSNMTAVGAGTQVPGFGFVGPEVIKIDWSTRSMNAHDMNGNGLTDVVLVNNDRSRIEILYQTTERGARASVKQRVGEQYWDPEIEDARFRRESVKVGYPIFDLRVGDFNADGLADLAFTAREVPLVVCYQDLDGGFGQRVEYDDFEAVGWTGSLWAGDLNGDAKDELVVIAADALRVYRQAGVEGLGEAEYFYVTGENPYNLMLCDVDQDGLLDALYLTSSGEQSLALRMQLKSGGFGPESRFVFDQPVRKVVALPRRDSMQAQPFVGIDSRSGGFEFFELRKREVSWKGRAYGDLLPEVTPLFKRGKGVSGFVYADLTGDGVRDALVSNPDRAELVLFAGGKLGQFDAPQSFPTIAGVSSLSAGRFYEKGRARALMVSEREQVLGMSAMDRAGRLSFPERIELAEGVLPLVCEAVDLDGDGLDELLLLAMEGAVAQLLVYEPAERKDPTSVWRERARYELGKTRRKPTSMRVYDSGDEGLRYIMLFVPREAPLVVRAELTGDSIKMEPYAEDSSIRESLLDGVTPATVSNMDFTGDGARELVIGRTGFARVLKFGADDLEMVDQLNARRGEDVVTAVLPVEAPDGVERVLCLIENEAEMQVLERSDDGVFRYREGQAVGPLQLLDWYALDEDKKRGGGFLLAGMDRLWVIPEFGASWARRITGNFETELDQVQFSHVRVADFAGNGLDDLVAVDGANHVVEVLSSTSNGWASRLYWKIFEQNLHYQGRTGGNLEPRQVVVADFDADGCEDFAFLVHDRILFYLQARAKK